MTNVEITMNVVGFDAEAMERNFDAAVAEAMRELRGEVERAWEEESTSGLKASEGTRKVYMDALRFSSTEHSVRVEGEGWLPRFLEFGVRRFDIKPGLLKGKPYRVVPIKVGGEVKFRTVREGQRGKWIHKGLDARKIRQRVFDKLFGQNLPPSLGKIAMKVMK